MLNRDTFRMMFIVREKTEQTVRLLLTLANNHPALGWSVQRLKCRLEHVTPAALFNLNLQLKLSGREPVKVIVELQVQPLPK